MTDTNARREALISELTAKLAKSEGAWPKLPWRVVPCDGKQTIAGTKHGGNLFRGYIATWDEAELAVAAVNALPAILALLATDRAAGVGEEAGETCAFVDCPPGLFRWSGLLCFKSEYSSKPGQQDAYCVDSGEYFWGGTNGDLERRRSLKVTPVAAASPPAPADASGEVERLRVALDWALAEIHGATRYPGSPEATPEQQRQNCLDEAHAALNATAGAR